MNWGNTFALSIPGEYVIEVGTPAGGAGYDLTPKVWNSESYRLSFVGRVEDPLEQFDIGVKSLDSTGTELMNVTARINSTTDTPGTLDFTVPAGATFTQMYVWKNAGNFGYVSGLKLEENATPVPAPAPAPAPSPTPTPVPAPTPAPAPVPLITSNIVLENLPSTLLEVGNYWIEDGVWGPGALLPGVYDGVNYYEQNIGIDKNVGPLGEIAWRMQWKWPPGTTEVKSYPSAVCGKKPGWQNSWTTPGGFPIRLLDGTLSQKYPSGDTPNTFFPLVLPVPPLYSSFQYGHVEQPTGRGHLSFDIWLQDSPIQSHGFSAPPISHEIMIPLTYWGDYGDHRYRNPAWYNHDVTLDGQLWHVFYATNFGGGWTFIVFEPDTWNAVPNPSKLNLATFINYLIQKGWASAANYCVSVELGVEPVEGTGDLVVSNYRVWK